MLLLRTRYPPRHFTVPTAGRFLVGVGNTGRKIQSLIYMRSEIPSDHAHTRAPAKTQRVRVTRQISPVRKAVNVPRAVNGVSEAAIVRREARFAG